MDVDKEFKNLISRLNDWEYEQLEASIRIEGCRDPLVLWGNILVDGHHRYEICTKHGIEFNTVQKEFESRREAKFWIYENQKARRNWNMYQRASSALKLKPEIEEKAKDKQREHGGTAPGKPKTLSQNSAEVNNAIDTRLELATFANVSHDTMGRVMHIDEYALPEEKEKLRKGDASINEIYRKVKKREKQQRRKELAEGGSNLDIPPSCTLYHGTMQDEGRNINDNSVDLILTDPPYGAEFLHLWDELAAFARRTLKPGKFLVTYSGQFHLPTVMYKLSQELDYYWTLSLSHTGNKQLINPRNIFCGWKPILVFAKPPLAVITDKIDDVIIGSGREKDLHDWQQAIDEVNPLIQAFTNKGDLIVDPFCGSGTISLAAYLAKRITIGIDKEMDNINITRIRINEQQLPND